MLPPAELSATARERVYKHAMTPSEIASIKIVDDATSVLAKCDGSCWNRQQKTARRRSFVFSNLMIVDQAAINAGFDFRR
jgi:hypothetical protein